MLKRQQSAPGPPRLICSLRTFGLRRVAARLACPPVTALRLFLAPSPCAEQWRTDVQTLAGRLGLEPAALTDLLVEAEALAVGPYQPGATFGKADSPHRWERR